MTARRRAGLLSAADGSCGRHLVEDLEDTEGVLWRILFALLVRPGAEKTDRGKLGPDGLRLSAPPSGPDEAPT